ncbi:sigma D regulator [Alginatibacterium sediminis]|uniref:Sigma D regulator n=1 Tax=Alginatibacterium sediminis TaxID=2164068 RepID=A0A420E7D8_9ALTE|nr:sigma D regulator [Alginatibacterium sediminis]RKF14436.1 sigma D regulator [Alginatibacterium sediminis]
MLTRVETAKQRWGGVSGLIDQWLDNRKSLLVNYCQLAGLPPFERKDNSLPEQSQITQFCEQLVDYVSTGHFEIYEQVISNCGDQEKQQQAQRLLPLLRDSTDAVLNFNDHFASTQDDIELKSFDLQLSQLGEAFESRFAIEDRMLEHLHQAQ